jgi:low affinity Fe/Cu permease
MSQDPHHKSIPLSIRVTEWMGSSASIVVHTIIFILSFCLIFFGVPFEKILLVLTTAVSLEAIYLALFIQMTVNRQAESIEDVAEDIDEIQEDVDEIQGDIDEIQEDVDEIQEDVVGISADIDEIQEEESPQINNVNLDTIYADLKRLMDDVEKFKQSHPKA